MGTIENKKRIEKCEDVNIKLEELLNACINSELYQLILSNPRSREGASKIKVRPVLVKDNLLYQASSFIGTQVFHQNMTAQELKEMIMEQLTASFRQAEVNGKSIRAVILVSKKGKITIQKKVVKNGAKESGAAFQPDINLSHNRSKRYILPEGQPVAFLMDLGVQTKEGKIIRPKYDKFRQINRFLEFIEDILPYLPQDRTVNIVDFGCGKSYLTFALYYYLKIIRNLDIRVTGLDLKEDVIRACNSLRDRYGYENLAFKKGDIASYEDEEQIDMVVTLHACDMATDYALEKAVKWKAGVILSVPCCQHELNRQLRNETLEPVLKYGIIKERMAALLTDGIRAELLSQMGYETQILEFIDMEHTPKNLLIRAVKKQGRNTGISPVSPAPDSRIACLLKEYNLNPAIIRLLRTEPSRELTVDAD